MKAEEEKEEEAEEPEDEEKDEEEERGRRAPMAARVPITPEQEGRMTVWIRIRLALTAMRQGSIKGGSYKSATSN